MVACRMNDILNNANLHFPVLLRESVAGLNIQASGIYLDATFGRGSHSRAILNQLDQNGRLIAFDKDQEAIHYAKQHIHDDRFQIIHTSFAMMEKTLKNLHLFGKIQGILFDLGVSSPQLDDGERGFSFMRNGNLDMRMDTTQGIDAASWIAQIGEKELADVLWQYGEEKHSRKISRAIVENRKEKAITTTAELAGIICSVLPKPRFHEKHPATRSFQAIRIAINQELEDLPKALDQALNSLIAGGRLCVISFHSLEDRIVKQFIKQHEKGEELPRGLPVKASSFQSRLKSIGKPIKPSLKELNINPRARSAILRIAEKPL
jgi:16S rRNA (cytosine1402-N4)-methyltransferase